MTIDFRNMTIDEWLKIPLSDLPDREYEPFEKNLRYVGNHGTYQAVWSHEKEPDRRYPFKLKAPAIHEYDEMGEVISQRDMITWVWDCGLDTRKVIPPEDEVKEPYRFDPIGGCFVRNEIRVYEDLKGTNLTPGMVDYRFDDDRPFIVMWDGGRSLGEILLDEYGGDHVLGERAKCLLARRIAEVVQNLHKEGWTHCDVRAPNIVLDSERVADFLRYHRYEDLEELLQTVKLIDFSFALALREDKRGILEEDGLRPSTPPDIPAVGRVISDLFLRNLRAGVSEGARDAFKFAEVIYRERPSLSEVMDYYQRKADALA